MKRRPLAGLLAALVLLALAFAVTACTQQSAPSDAGAAAPEPAPAGKQAAEEPKEPEYKSWTVHINDDDSFSQGSVTYKIALNFTATNPSAQEAGTYTGKATASTSTNGTVGEGGQLDANAIANSGNLQFKLEDTTAGGALSGLTSETAGADLLSGTGTITMKAAGTATVNGASGGFANTSSQQIKLDVQGSKVTLKVGISGHTYTFHGTISGNE